MIYIISKDRIAENIEENGGLKPPPIRGRGAEVSESDIAQQIQYDAERDRRGLVQDEERAQWKKTGYNPRAGSI